MKPLAYYIASVLLWAAPAWSQTASLLPASLAFGNQAVNTTSSARPVTLTNTGTLSLGITNITVTGTNAGDFQQTNACPATLAPAAHCTINLTYQPKVLGGESASLSVTDNATSSPQTVGLSGIGVVPAYLSASSLAFASVGKNSPSTARTVTLYNNLSTPLGISSITTGNADFAQTSNCGTSVAARGYCTISVVLTPSVLGADTGTLTVSDSAANSPQTAALTGTGVVPAYLSATSLAFGSVGKNSPSAGKTVMLYNSQTVPLVISNITTGNPDFTQTNNCGTSVAAKAFCTITVTLKPTILGADSGTLTVTDSASNSPQTAGLSGTGVVPAYVSATSLAFSNVGKNSPSTGRILTLYNSQAVPLVISNITTGNPDFAQSNTCGSSVVPNGRCTITVTLTPSVLGADAGTLTVIDSASNTPQTAALSGTGVVPAYLSPTSLAFGSVGENSPSAGRSVMIFNSQAVPLVISNITTGNPDFAQTNTCGSSVAANGHCTITVTLTPSVLGGESGTLTVTDSASNTPQTLALTGTGVVPAYLSATSLAFGSVGENSPSAVKTVMLFNSQAVPLQISNITTGNPDYTQTNNCGTSVAAKGNCTITVTLTPSVLGTDTGTLTVTDSASNTPQTAALTGTGVVPAYLSATSLAFGSVGENSPSGGKTVMLFNSQTVPLTISNIATGNPDYTQTNNCGTSVAAKGNCTITVTLTPSVLGADSGTLTVTDSASNTPQTAALTGTGVVPAYLSATSLAFGSVGENSPSVGRTVILFNSQAVPLQISNLTTGNPDYAQTNNCGASVAAKGSCTITVTLTPSVLGTDSGTLTVTDTASNSPQTASLSGTGVVPVTLSPTSWTFSTQTMFTASPTKPILLTNNLATALPISTITFTGANPHDFTVSSSTCGSSLASKGNCTIYVAFTPTLAGTRTATLTVNDGAPNSPQTMTLSGTGMDPPVSFSPPVLSFGTQLVGTTSAPLVETLINTTTESLTVTSAKISAYNAADFAVTADNCTGITLAPNNTCTVSLTFTPGAMGDRNTYLFFTDNGPRNPQYLVLNGTGVQPRISFSAPAISFSNQPSNSTSAATVETVTNTGTANLTISAVTIAGTNAADFGVIADTCTGATVTPGNTCAVSVTFTPSTTGSRSASLNFTDNAPYGVQSLALSGAGTGSPVSFSAVALSFASQAPSTTSAAQNEVVTNAGAGSLTITAATLGGANAGDFAISADSCSGQIISPVNTCTVSVTFTPSATGVRCATLNFATSAAGSPQTVNLTGLGAGPLTGVLTQRYDNGRTGQNLQEVYLSPSNVTQGQFGKLFTLLVDGQVYAQPLYLENVSIAGQGAHNVIFVATENDSVYAYDADTSATTPLWQVSFINPAAGVITVSYQDVQNPDINPQLGITSTPVIDSTSGTIYVVAETKELQNSSCTSNCTYNYVHRLHALDITSGAEKFGGPVVISASVPGTGYDNVGGIVTFNALWQLQRPGLLLLNGKIFIGFGSNADIDPYHGWLMAYDATTLQQVAVFNVTPNARRGSIWHAGGGIAADADGYIYVVTANGTFDADKGGVDYGDTVLKLQLVSGQFQVVDYFTPADQAYLDLIDLDLGSSPPLLLPDQPGTYPHLLTAGGKDGRMWLLNRDNLGHLQANDAGALQVIPDGSTTLFAGCTYWNGSFYVQEQADSMRQFTVENGVATNASSTSMEFGGFPNSPSPISSNGTSNAVLWMVQTGAYSAGASFILDAFDASDLDNEIYTTNEDPIVNDRGGPAVKFVVPTVANGKVYIGAAGEVDVYGLLP